MLRKSFYSSLLLLIFIFSIPITLGSINAKEFDQSSKSSVIEGIVYGEFIKEVITGDQLNAKLQVKNVVIHNEKVSFDFNLSYNDIVLDLKASGSIYNPSKLFLKESNGVNIILDSENEDIVFLSMLLEGNAYKEMLLPINQELLSNKEVIKLALLDKRSNQLVYFEGLIPDEISLSEIKKNAKNAEVSSVLESVQFAETWYVPFLSNQIESKVLQVYDDTNKNQMISPSAVSPVESIPVSVFKNVGKGTYTGSTAYGYYYYTVEFPVGTSNRLTNLIKWSWIHNDPGTFSSSTKSLSGDILFEIVEEAEYAYLASTDRIVFQSDFAYHRIKNLKVDFGIATENSQIITKIERDGRVNNGSLNVDWKNFLGALPFGKLYTSAATLFNSVSFKSQTSSNILTYHDSVSANEKTYGDAIRAHRIGLSTNDYLQSEGDKLGFKYTITVPTDKPRSTGSKTVYYKYTFDIYMRNSSLLYNIHQASVDRNIIGSYIVR